VGSPISADDGDVSRKTPIFLAFGEYAIQLNDAASGSFPCLDTGRGVSEHIWLARAIAFDTFGCLSGLFQCE